MPRKAAGDDTGKLGDTLRPPPAALSENLKSVVPGVADSSAKTIRSIGKHPQIRKMDRVRECWFKC